MVLLVDVGGVNYLTDVGFGGQVATAPLRLRADIEQQVGDEKYRLSGGHPKWRLETEIKGEWQPHVRVHLAPQTLDDYVAMNDGTAASFFRDNLVAARVEGSKRHGLYNARLNTHENGETQTRMLTTRDRDPRHADQRVRHPAVRRATSSTRRSRRRSGLEPTTDGAVRRRPRRGA